jgi:hypothetical protein
MEKTGWYNGYDWNARTRKLKEQKKRMAVGDLPVPTGPCELCGDPDAMVEYHDEDYSRPYLWASPAAFVVCRHCHVHKLHKRFAHRARWQAFLAHVRRGGYASELKDPVVAKELASYQAAVASGRQTALRTLRPYRATAGQEWFAKLTTDPASLTDTRVRPRP